jgi:hypothetical protein
MVGPHDEPEDADANHGIDHAQIAEDRFASKGTDHMTHNAKPRQDQNVHLRVAEEPKEVLIENGIPTTRWIKEGGVKVAIRQQHGDGSRKHRQRQEQQKGRDQHRPHKKRETMHGHAWSTHVEDRGDQVDGTEQTANPREMETENSQIHGPSRVIGNVGQGWIHGPPSPRPDLDQGRAQQKQQAWRQEPKTDVI